MSTIASTSTLPAPASAPKTATKKTTPSVAPVKKPVAAAKRVAKTASAPVQGAEATKVVSTSTTPAKKSASAKPSAPLAANGKAAPAAKATTTALPEAKPSKEKKQKMVRDSVTIPKAEYQALDAMKQRAAQLKTMVKKTELIRAGIKHLSGLSDAAFLAAIANVPSLKTGRPSKG